MTIKTVKLEILRPGPPHNQLLSPLTDYIVLCGDEPPELFRVPFEHYRLLRRIQDIRSHRAPAVVEASFIELRDEVIRMLSSIRSLTAALAEAHGDGAHLVELELVLSASELSLIPFEVAFTPGSPTREIAHREVIITRRSRRVPRARLEWLHRPRILLIAASPPGFRPVPIQEHVTALRAALAPWLIYIEGQTTDKALTLSETAKYLVIVPNASERTIQSAILDARREGHPFTHVHVLVHGGEIGQDDEETLDLFREPRFGLVLHDSNDPERRDILTGRRFFSAIACGGSLPQVVTLASCDAGNIGGVVIPSASVAHDVHDGGVPVVVAAQFPLSYSGSVVFVRQLYSQLLKGEDPRQALRETRRAVHAGQVRDSGASDWAALVQYGSLPPDTIARVDDAKILALRQHLDAAVSSVNPFIAPRSSGDMMRAWLAIDANLRILQNLARTDSGLARYLAGFHLRWAFIVRDVDREHPAKNEKPAHWDDFVQKRGELGSGPNLRVSADAIIVHHLREASRGMLRAYHETRRPEELISYLQATHYLGEPLPAHHVHTAALQCIQARSFELMPRIRRLEMERSLVMLWIVMPGIAAQGSITQQHIESLLAEHLCGSRWAFDILDAHLRDVPPASFDFYALRRHVGRVRSRHEDLLEAERARLAPEASQDEHRVSLLEEIERRAAQVDERLRNAGVPEYFSAIVDWEDLPDGTRLTVAT